MSTRGIMGFVVDGEVKASYNHFDSYPSGLGQDLIDEIKSADLEELAKGARALKVVSEEKGPTKRQIERLRKFLGGDEPSEGIEEWSSLLSGQQGSIKRTLETGIILDCGEFPRYSLFCEWGYLVNLDDGVFEVYRGFQRVPHALGRFASLRPVETPSEGVLTTPSRWSRRSP